MEKLIEKLACPVCKYDFDINIDTLRCMPCNEFYYESKGVLDLLPKKPGWNTVYDILRKPIGPKPYLMSEAARNKDVQLADDIIQRFVAEFLESTDQIEYSTNALRILNQIYKKNQVDMDDEQRAAFLSYITLARYELETAAGSYSGTFVIPDKILNQLPENKDYFEIAMGPGDNLRNIQKLNPNSITGCDFSKGMVERAKDMRGLFFRADGQYLPVKDEQYDVVMMFNCLDRIPNTKLALEEASRVLREDGTLIVGNCIPLQNEKEVEGGIIMKYVPENYRINSMEEAIEISGCKIEDLEKNLKWNIQTISDGKETLYVDVAIGRKK